MPWTAGIDVARTDLRKAAELLPRQKGLLGVDLRLEDTPLTDEELKLLKSLPAARDLQISASQLTERDVNMIASLKHVENLSLASRDVFPELLRPLQAMKGLKQLTILSGNKFSEAAEAKLQKAFPGVKVGTNASSVFPTPAIYFFPLIKPAETDSAEAKLKKEKFNAALAAFRHIQAKIRAGTRDFTYADDPMLLNMQAFKNSILDLDDPGMRVKAFDAYVDLTKIAEKESQFKLDAGNLDPYKYDLIRYYHLDAQLIQLQLKKQAEMK